MIKETFGSVSLAVAVSLALPATVSADPLELVRRISAGTIVAISDGDFVAQSYATGRLAPRAAGYRDQLTVLGVADGRVVAGSTDVSNSVTAAPEILQLTDDGRTAFVVERLGGRTPQSEKVADLPPGRRLFAVDLTNKTAPRLTDTLEIAAFPEALSVHPNGRRIAVVSNTPQASFVQIVDFANGRFGTAARFDLADLGVTGSAPGPRGGVTATNVHWHPSGRFLAVNVNTQNRVAFLEVVDAGDRPALRPWGNIVEVGRDPFVGRFTPDGRYYLTSNWGRDFAATTIEGRLPRAPSSISVIRLADDATPAATARHAVVGETTTDLSPEGIAVSPDGRLVATVNMRGTALPTGSARFHREATVTLLTFDPASGALTKVADYPFEGVLPEGGTFDLTGDHFLATVFHGHQEADAGRGAGLEVFRVSKGDRPSLERLGRIPLPHGVHHVDVAR